MRLHYAELAGTDGWFGKAKTGHYQYYPFMNVGHFRLYDLVDKDVRENVCRVTIAAEIESCEKASAGNPYRDRRAVHLVLEQSYPSRWRRSVHFTNE